MSILMFNPGKDNKTMQCSNCHNEFKVIFCCNGCSQPVCVHCGLLKQPGKTQLIALVDNVNIPRKVDKQREIGMNEWFETDDPQENFYCPTCQ